MILVDSAGLAGSAGSLDAGAATKTFGWSGATLMGLPSIFASLSCAIHSLAERSSFIANFVNRFPNLLARMITSAADTPHGLNNSATISGVTDSDKFPTKTVVINRTSVSREPDLIAPKSPELPTQPIAMRDDTICTPIWTLLKPIRYILTTPH
jgi:hypothetical protein